MIYIVECVVSKLERVVSKLVTLCRSDKWRSGVVVEEIGLTLYMIEVQDGSVHKCHVDHIYHREESSSVATRSTNSHVSDKFPLVTFPNDHTADSE